MIAASTSINHSILLKFKFLSKNPSKYTSGIPQDLKDKTWLESSFSLFSFKQKHLKINKSDFCANDYRVLVLHKIEKLVFIFLEIIPEMIKSNKIKFTLNKEIK